MKTVILSCCLDPASYFVSRATLIKQDIKELNTEKSLRQQSGVGSHQFTSTLPCVTEEEDQLVLGDDKGSKNSTLPGPLVSQVGACMFVWGCMSVRGGGGTWTDITVSHLLLNIFTESDFNTSLKWGQIHPDTQACIDPFIPCPIYGMLLFQMRSPDLTSSFI